MYDSRIDTYSHIKLVGNNITKLITKLLNRITWHDHTKIQSPEKEILDQVIPKLSQMEYGSAEYTQSVKELEPMSQHHYENNSHHPEFYSDGIKGMDLVDLCEMICDWKAATLRNKNGNIYKSIDINQTRFGYSDEIKQILINTVDRHLV